MNFSCSWFHCIAIIALGTLSSHPCFLIHVVDGFSPQPTSRICPQTFHSQKLTTQEKRISILVRRSVVPNNDESEATKGEGTCPFSMTFPRYRIPISGGKDKSNDNTILSGLFGGMILSTQKLEFERKYYANEDRKVVWHDPKIENVSSNEIKNDDDRIIKGKIGIHVSAFVWQELSKLLQETIQHSVSSSGMSKSDQCKSVVIGLPNASLVGLKQITDIINWMGEEQNYYVPPSLKSNIQIHAKTEEDSPVPTIILSTTLMEYEREMEHMSVSIDEIASSNYLTEEIVTKRTKAWVDRVLVKMRICPFTRSTTKSGQGLGDVGVPVGSIAYHYSNALQHQFPIILADTWEAISSMIKAGPSGKNGVSSILLAAPEFDSDFSLWAGPLFAMLEAGVTSARAEPIIGIVCFHPDYKTPDGQSWPGFGHMHSVPRLTKWVKENDNDLYNNVDERDVSAGGAFQRRTPHATINVLRAEQLEAAEGRRSTGILYSVNIRRLFEEGFDKLNDDLKKEQNLTI